MKKLFGMAAVLVLGLSACGNLGITQSREPYHVKMAPWGYVVDDKGKFTIPEINVTVDSHAGAPDIDRLEYTARLLNTKDPTVLGDDSQIVPEGATLAVGIKGGYQCETTPAELCTAASPDAELVDTTTNFQVQVDPGEWAEWHRANYLSENKDSAAFKVEVDFTAHQANGGEKKWTQYYQFVAPAK